MSKFEAWLPAPWEWHQMRGRLGCDKEFEGAEIKARRGQQLAVLVTAGPSAESAGIAERVAA